MAMIVALDGVVARIKEIKTMPVQEGKLEMNPKDYSIDFKDVEFGYEDYTVINGVSFTAKQGEVTALIGPSGSGKTTLTKLVARFWDIQKGKILLGGEDISRGRKLGFIAQEIGREINTMGSKANDHDIQKLVVRMKDELEKIKEQSLNVL